MARLLDKLRFLFGNRRKRDDPHDDDRRGGGGGGFGKMKEADKKLRDSVDELNRTVRLRRDDFKCVVANDRQQVVIFSTFREICTSKGPQIGWMRLCRHDNHVNANDPRGAICDEELCPKLNAALLKGAA